MYVVFQVYGDGDSYSIYNLIGASHSLDGGKELVAKCFAKQTNPIGVELVHKDMCKDNLYTYIGNRSDCDNSCDYCSFGGFVIEQIEMDTLIK